MERAATRTCLLKEVVLNGLPKMVVARVTANTEQQLMELDGWQAFAYLQRVKDTAAYKPKTVSLSKLKESSRDLPLKIRQWNEDFVREGNAKVTGGALLNLPSPGTHCRVARVVGFDPEAQKLTSNGEWEVFEVELLEPLPGGAPGSFRTKQPLERQRLGWSTVQGHQFSATSNVRQQQQQPPAPGRHQQVPDETQDGDAPASGARTMGPNNKAYADPLRGIPLVTPAVSGLRCAWTGLYTANHVPEGTPGAHHHRRCYMPLNAVLTVRASCATVSAALDAWKPYLVCGTCGIGAHPHAMPAQSKKVCLSCLAASLSKTGKTFCASCHLAMSEKNSYRNKGVVSATFDVLARVYAPVSDLFDIRCELKTFGPAQQQQQGRQFHKRYDISMDVYGLRATLPRQGLLIRIEIIDGADMTFKSWNDKMDNMLGIMEAHGKDKRYNMHAVLMFVYRSQLRMHLQCCLVRQWITAFIEHATVLPPGDQQQVLVVTMGALDFKPLKPLVLDVRSKAKRPKTKEGAGNKVSPPVLLNLTSYATDLKNVANCVPLHVKELAYPVHQDLELKYVTHVKERAQMDQVLQGVRCYESVDFVAELQKAKRRVLGP